MNEGEGGEDEGDTRDAGMALVAKVTGRFDESVVAIEAEAEEMAEKKNNGGFGGALVEPSEEVKADDDETEAILNAAVGKAPPVAWREEENGWPLMAAAAMLGAS